MNSELKAKINEIISCEYKLMLHETHLMAIDHMFGLQGYKRVHRYQSRDRLEHAIKLTNFIVEFNQEKPEVSVTFATPAEPPSLVTGIEQMVSLGRFQIERLKSAASMAIDHNEHHLMSELECMLKDQEWEVIRYERMVKEIRNTGDSMLYVQQRSEYLHEKYKAKEKDWKVYS